MHVQLFNSAYVARVSVPESGVPESGVPDSGREITVMVPDGLIPVRVTDRVSREPIASAQVTWVAGGARVEASATAGGDVLLEAAGAGGGTLTVSARGYQTLEGAFEETPETLQEVSLNRLPSGVMQVRVVSDEGKPLASAIVELVPRHPGEAAEFVATDGKGIARFIDVSPGAVQLNASAEGFAAASVRVPDKARATVVITLTRR